MRTNGRRRWPPSPVKSPTWPTCAPLYPNPRLEQAQEVSHDDSLYVSSFGSDDPTCATLAFVGGGGALDAGFAAQIALVGETTYLMKDPVADQIHGVGWPPLRELLNRVIEHGVPIFV